MINYIEPSVVVIDDVENEIKGIVDIYSSKGIGCKLFNPDYIDGDTMPDKPFSDVNLIFLDLFYSDKFDAEQSCNWVRSIIPEKTFYVIVFWTKDHSKANEVLTLLNSKKLSPFLYFVESKSDYVLNGTYDFSGLITKISDECKKTPALEEILYWKKTVKYSSNEIIGNLTKSPNDIVNKLKKIIISHGGTSIKESEDNDYKRSILFDALDTVLISNTKKNINGKISELNKQSLYDLKELQNTDTDKELNSWFHFKLENEISQNLITPGLIAINNHRFFKKLYSIQDDSKLIKLFQVQKDNGIRIDDIVLVISRPCDIAQKKFGKNIKLLSGVIIYNAHRHPTGKRKHEIHFNDQAIPDSIKKYEHLYLTDKLSDITILFDFRYSFSVPEKIFTEKFQNLKIFNKELLSEMQVEYSSYSSRLGITQII